MTFRPDPMSSLLPTALSVLAVAMVPVAFAARPVASSGLAMLKAPTPTQPTAGGIRIPGPGAQPQLGFACCDGSIAEAQEILSDQVIAALRSLHASVAIPTSNFSPERARLVQRLNRAQIPVIAWLVLDKNQGLYFNADNVTEAPPRVAAFEAWTSANRLQWFAVGFDVEPNFDQLGRLKAHRWRLFGTLLHRAIDGARMRRARSVYEALIADLQSHGFVVQTYQMPYLPAERSVHSTLIDRLLGSVDVRGNEEYLMLYTNMARPVGAGMIWSLGRGAQSIAIGSTGGPGTPGVGSGPLDWNEFRRDLIVASHFTHHIGVYNLEGCIDQGFLPRLQAMDWNQGVVIPADSVHRAERMGLLIRVVLWTLSNFVYILVVLLVLLGWLIHRRRKRRARALSAGRMRTLEK